jgi:hypothetical protein
MMCLPGPAVPGGDCGQAQHGGRLRVTRTASITAAASGSFSRSATPREAEARSADRPFSTQHQVAVAASTAMVLKGWASASMMQRMLAQQRINNCGKVGEDGNSAVDFSSSMTLGKDEDGAATYTRGTVVGNLLLWLAFCVAGFAAARIMHLRGAAESVREAEAELGLPGWLCTPFMMLLVPTLSAATALVASVSSSPALDAAIAAGAFSVSAAALAGIAMLTTGRRFGAKPVHPKAERGYATCESLSLQTLTLSQFRRLVMFKLSREKEWADRGRHSGFTGRWGEVFEAYRPGRQWFLAVEVAAGAATAVLAGLAEAARDGGACSALLQQLSIVVDLAFLLALSQLKPNAVPLEHLFALSNAGVTSLSSILGAFDLDTSYLTAAQTVLNVIGMSIIFYALISEGSLSKHVRGLMLVLHHVWKGIALRRRRAVKNRDILREDQLELERRLCVAIARHSPPNPPPTASEISRILETLLRLSACAVESTRQHRRLQQEQEEQQNLTIL